MRPVAVGLVGAGPWGSGFHAPMLAAGPQTRLAGVWSRRPERAREVAARFAVPAFADYDLLLDACEAVAFAVPPEVQVSMAVRAARAGRALLLEKPLAPDLAGATALAEAVDAAGVPTQLMLTRRYRPQVREFLDRARRFRARGAQARHLTDELFSAAYATPWRRRQGVLDDFGFHALDLLDAALGTVKDVMAVGDPHGYMALTCVHEGEGAVSQLALCGSIGSPHGHHKTMELYGREGALVLDFRELADDSAPTRENVRSEFAATVRSGVPHTVDVHHGLHLQRLLEQARSQLRGVGDGS
ncbi:Gfo/Idh/MocA family protein [Microbispora corallina]|nr:Gfo/Idh/MocA family oxidoreductase [Microbispora corallina]